MATDHRPPVRQRVDVADLEGQAGNGAMHPARFFDEGRIDVDTDHLPVGGNGSGNVPRHGPRATPHFKNRQTRPQESHKTSMRRLQGAGIQDALRPFWHMGSVLCSAF